MFTHLRWGGGGDVLSPSMGRADWLATNEQKALEAEMSDS